MLLWLVVRQCLVFAITVSDVAISQGLQFLLMFLFSSSLLYFDFFMDSFLNRIYALQPSELLLGPLWQFMKSDQVNRRTNQFLNHIKALVRSLMVQEKKTSR